MRAGWSGHDEPSGPISDSGPGPDIEVEVRFLTTDEGGREGPVRSGYRRVFHFDGTDWGTDQEYPGRDGVTLGETVTGHYWFIFSPPRVFPGAEFMLREGVRVVARGVVTRVFGRG